MKTVREEIRQTKPFRTKEQEALVALLVTADVLRRRFSEIIEPHGITMQQYNVLRILRGAGEAGLPTLEIAERMIEKTPGVTRLLDRLEAKGLVRRERCRSDRRQVLCWISPAGLELLEALDDPVEEADRRVMAGLKKQEIAQFALYLDVVRAGAR